MSAFPEALLLERMAHYAIPGAALALIADSEIAAEAGYGVKEAGGDDPVTPATRFQACSISKPVAVLGMLRLVEQGVLDLDADVNEMLMSWRVPPNASWQPRVTLRQIASHSAGLTVGGFPGYARRAALPTLREILTGSAPANTPGIRVDTLPGIEFRYAGGGTTVLQQVLEDVTGRPFAKLMRELVLDPLGMSRSAYTQPLPNELHADASTAHRADGSPVDGAWHVYPELAAAGLWTTPGDLARFAVGVQHAAAGAPSAILGQELTVSMLTPHSGPASRLGGLDSVGLGLFLGGPWFGHSGGNEGFRCHLVAHRDAGCGLAVMTNGDRGHELIAEVLGESRVTWVGRTGRPPRRPRMTARRSGSKRWSVPTSFARAWRSRSRKTTTSSSSRCPDSRQSGFSGCRRPTSARSPSRRPWRSTAKR